MADEYISREAVMSAAVAVLKDIMHETAEAEKDALKRYTMPAIYDGIMLGYGRMTEEAHEALEGIRGRRACELAGARMVIEALKGLPAADSNYCPNCGARMDESEDEDDV